MRAHRFSILTLVLPAIACAASEAPGPDAPAEATAAASPAPAIENTVAPEDSVVVWAEEIRAGIAPLSRQVTGDPGAARQRAVELYVTRQERIEQAAGPGTGAPAELADSVHEAETRFHELMQLLGETPPPDSAAVERAVTALDTRLASVIDLATAPAPAGSR